MSTVGLYLWCIAAIAVLLFIAYFFGWYQAAVISWCPFIILVVTQIVILLEVIFDEISSIADEGLPIQLYIAAWIVVLVWPQLYGRAVWIQVPLLWRMQDLGAILLLRTRKPAKYKFGVPLNMEWDQLLKLTDYDNDKIHWKHMAFWTAFGISRGYLTASSQEFLMGTNRGEGLGFRPAVAIRSLGAPFSSMKEGESAVIGTLYMGGKPIRVPQQPDADGDIQPFVPGDRLEFRKPMDDPAYQVTGIRVGNVFIADRCLLKQISAKDIREAIKPIELTFAPN